MDFEFHRLLRILKARMWIVLLLVIVVCGLAAVYTLNAKSEFMATSKIIVNSKNTGNDKPLDFSQLNANIQLIDTYKQIILSSTILEAVAKNMPELHLTLDQLAQSIQVESIENTQIMYIYAFSNDADLAVRIANEVSHEFQKQIPAIMNVDNISILDEAQTSASLKRISNDPVLAVLFAFVLSLLLSAGIIFVLEMIDDSFKSEAELQESLGVPLLGTILKIKKKDMRQKNSGSISKGKVSDTTYAGVN